MPRLSDKEARRYVPQSWAKPVTRIARRIASAEDVYRETEDIRDLPQEHLIVFYLNARHCILERRTLNIGSASGVECHPRDVFRGAILANACGIIIVHNHPSGDTSPSRPDIELTARISEAGEIMGIPLLDHVIVGSGGYTSLSSSGYLAIFGKNS
jgi:DNA repair protein RadC